MPLTVAQTTAFFENNNDIGLANATRLALADEGITTVNDLLEFDKDTIEQIASNFRRLTPPIPFAAKSQKRLIEACELLRFYRDIGRDVTPAIIHYVTIQDFAVQWEALIKRRDGTQPAVPKITRELGILRWSKAFRDFLCRCIGVRGVPLRYVTRAEATPGTPSAIANGLPHSTEHGSVEADLIAYASHTHPLFRDDSAKVYYYLEEATRSTMYAPSLAPFSRTKDGRGAHAAIIAQYAGLDKWDQELHRCDDLMKTRKWKGQSNFQLEKYVAQHRAAFISMQDCTEFVPFQLPNDLTRVKYMLNGIENSDADLKAAIALVRTDDGADGAYNNFEKAAAFIIPLDPVAKRRICGNKRPAGEVSGIESSSKKPKSGTGSSGVELRYYKRAEYVKLSKAQKDELRDWREEMKKAGKPLPSAKSTAQSQE